MEKQLQGKVAIITGASSGVGRAIARAFGAAGAKVGLIARGLEGLEAAAREIREAGGDALVLPLDVSDEAAVSAAAKSVYSAWGRIDIWVNNAMVSVFSPTRKITPSEFRRVMEVNYLGYVHGTLAALKYMRLRSSGTILQIGSALAYRSIPLQSAYCASKAAIRGFTDSLRSELIRERSDIKLAMLRLPAVNTPQFEVVRSRLPKHPQPVPPIYQPETIAEAALYALSHPKREMWLGWSTTAAILGQKIFPKLLDRYLAKRAWESQMTEQIPEGHPPRHKEDNLDAPLPGDLGAHGIFDDRARSLDTRLWVRTHQRGLAFMGLVLLASLLVAKKWRAPENTTDDQNHGANRS